MKYRTVSKSRKTRKKRKQKKRSTKQSYKRTKRHFYKKRKTQRHRVKRLIGGSESEKTTLLDAMKVASTVEDAVLFLHDLEQSSWKTLRKDKDFWKNVGNLPLGENIIDSVEERGGLTEAMKSGKAEAEAEASETAEAEEPESVPQALVEIQALLEADNPDSTVPLILKNVWDHLADDGYDSAASLRLAEKSDLIKVGFDPDEAATLLRVLNSKSGEETPPTPQMPAVSRQWRSTLPKNRVDLRPDQKAAAAIGGYAAAMHDKEMVAHNKSTIQSQQQQQQQQPTPEAKPPNSQKPVSWVPDLLLSWISSRVAVPSAEKEAAKQPSTQAGSRQWRSTPPENRVDLRGDQIAAAAIGHIK